MARVDLLIPGRNDVAERLTVPPREVFATRLADKMTSSIALLVVAQVRDVEKLELARVVARLAIISRNGLEAWILFPERARAEHSR